MEWLNEPWVRALLAIGAGLLMAFFLDRYVVRWLHWLTRKTKTSLDDQLIEILKRPILVSVMLGGIWAAAMAMALKGALAGVVAGILGTTEILVWAGALWNGSRRLMDPVARRGRRGSVLQRRTLPLFDVVAKVVIFTAAVYFGLLAWDIDVTGWLASAGIVGIALGFAAKDTLANLFAGIFILADAPYEIGDTIVLDGTRGVVTDIGMRSTRVLTRDDVEINVPNGLIANIKIANESGGPAIKTRLRLPVSVAYGSELEQVRSVLLACVEGVGHVCEKPVPRARFLEMGDSELVFSLDVYIDTPIARDDVIDELNSRVYDSLQAAGLEIPFPQRDVHVRTSSTA